MDILARGEMLCAVDSAGKQEVSISELSKLYPVHN